MNYPIFSVKSSVPLGLLVRYFRKIDGVSWIEVHGFNEDFCIDLIFKECQFYIDRQFGFIQLHMKNESCEGKHVDLFVSHFEKITRGFFSALFTLICLSVSSLNKNA